MKNINHNIYIDFLRGYAVLLVYLYHIGFLKNGNIGVDLFFVLSGFLIFNSIENLNSTDNLLKNFYLRRIYRIIPPLLIFYVFTFIFLYLVVSDRERAEYIKNGISSFFFLANYHQLLNSGYFDLSNKYNPFGHLWSLSIEEQFYFIVIPLLYFFEKYLRKFYIICSLCFLSISLNIFTLFSSSGIELPYLDSFHRSYELCFGMLIFYFYKNKNIFFNSNKIFIIIFLIYLIIIFILSLFDVSQNLYFSFAIRFFVAFITTLILAVLLSKTNLQKNSDNLFFNIIQLLGKYSYGFYLYHYPLIVFYRWNFGVIELVDAFTLFIVTLLFSHLSYTYVEKYFLNRSKKIIYL